MNYISTRGLSAPVSAGEAILRGLAPDGGLYVPEFIPAFSAEERKMLPGLSYRETALLVLKKYIAGFEDGELEKCIKEAYASFDTEDPSPIVSLPDGHKMLELWHGPTCAFKDMALQLMPRLLSLCREKAGIKEELHILVATSGDTGKAALEGFRDVPGTRITVFYPKDGVSEVQKAQMVTQRGENVCVCGVNGNFDDAQSAVKEIFADRALAERLEKRGVLLSSANSINWGRLLPQIVYYVRTAFAVSGGEKVNFSVPTGNFGNILAAFYAKRMGAPIGKLLCASNANNVLTDFFKTGVYDRRRPFYRTISPSMDILVSSNLERLLFLVSGGDHGAVRKWMESLTRDGAYAVPEELMTALKEDFDAAYCGEEDTGKVIRETYEKLGYLCDTHTAVALYAARKLPMPGKTVVVSTASPFKFASDVLAALGEEKTPEGFEALDSLSAVGGLPIPRSLAELKELPVRFTLSADPDKIRDLL